MVNPFRKIFQNKNKNSPVSYPRLSENTLLFAIGDLHGRVDLLEEILKKIESQSAGGVSQRKILVFLGDYIDRGPDSRALVEYLIHPPLTGFETIYLRGNHEDMMDRFLTRPEMLTSWLLNGGRETLLSYGLSEKLLRSAEPAQIHAEFNKALPDTHRNFFRTLQYSYEFESYFFAHAGIRPGTPIGDQRPEDLMWVREAFLSSSRDHGKIIIHGHSIRDKVDFQRNRIGIDTGAFLSGRLTALILGAEEPPLVLQTGEEAEKSRRY